MHMLIEIRSMLQSLVTRPADKSSAFFKTGVGQYAEGDIFIGITVPNFRKIAKQFTDITRENLTSLIRSKINEERLLALFILVRQYTVASEQQKEELYQFYLRTYA